MMLLMEHGTIDVYTGLRKISASLIGNAFHGTSN